jgi:hypothetical protein
LRWLVVYWLVPPPHNIKAATWSGHSLPDLPVYRKGLMRMVVVIKFQKGAYELTVRLFWEQFFKFESVCIFKLIMRIIQSMACNNFVNLFGFKPLDTGKTCKAMRIARQRANIWLIVVG